MVDVADDVAVGDCVSVGNGVDVVQVDCWLVMAGGVVWGSENLTEVCGDGTEYVDVEVVEDVAAVVDYDVVGCGINAAAVAHGCYYCRVPGDVKYGGAIAVDDDGVGYGDCHADLPAVVGVVVVLTLAVDVPVAVALACDGVDQYQYHAASEEGDPFRNARPNRATYVMNSKALGCD